MFLYIETKTGRTSSFILPVIDNWKQPWLTSGPKREIDRDRKGGRGKHWKDETALSRGVQQNRRLLTLIDGVDIDFRPVWLWSNNVNFSKALTFRNVDSLIYRVQHGVRFITPELRLLTFSKKSKYRDIKRSDQIELYNLCRIVYNMIGNATTWLSKLPLRNVNWFDEAVMTESPSVLLFV